MQIAYDDVDDDDDDDDDDYDEERMSVPAFSSTARGEPRDWHLGTSLLSKRTADYLKAIYFIIFDNSSNNK